MRVCLTGHRGDPRHYDQGCLRQPHPGDDWESHTDPRARFASELAHGYVAQA
jgi:hypothetical protein